MKMLDIVFDLDGTLIDSAPSILVSMQAAFEQAGITPSRPLTPALIGPPLAQTLRSVLPDTKAHALPSLIEGFKRHYDTAGYKQARVYPGVQDMLHALSQMQVSLYIATNKRIAPTRLIVEYLGWSTRFAGVYALDFYHPALAHKAIMLQCLRQSLAERGRAPFYVGDRSEDAEAAQACGMPFLWASWGYGGDCVAVLPASVLAAPAQLLCAIRNPHFAQEDKQ